MHDSLVWALLPQRLVTDPLTGQQPQTRPENLGCLCREHHRAKHQLHWTPHMQPDGSIRWRNNLLQITAYA